MFKIEVWLILQITQQKKIILIKIREDIQGITL